MLSAILTLFLIARLLLFADMHVFGLKPMADPLKLVRCGILKTMVYFGNLKGILCKVALFLQVIFSCPTVLFIILVQIYAFLTRLWNELVGNDFLLKVLVWTWWLVINVIYLLWIFDLLKGHDWYTKEGNLRKFHPTYNGFYNSLSRGFHYSTQAWKSNSSLTGRINITQAEWCKPKTKLL